MLTASTEILKSYVNMSSALGYSYSNICSTSSRQAWVCPTSALGPGFSSDQLLLHNPWIVLAILLIILIAQRLSELALAKRNYRWATRHGRWGVAERKNSLAVHRAALALAGFHDP